MMKEEDIKLLFPLFPIMHVGQTITYNEYLLSAILGTHGFTIKRIYGCSGYMKVLCCSGPEENRLISTLLIPPVNNADVPCTLSEWNELRIRYHLVDGELTDPVWTQAYTYGNGMKGCWLGGILDLNEMKYSEF